MSLTDDHEGEIETSLNGLAMDLLRETGEADVFIIILEEKAYTCIQQREIGGVNGTR